MSCLRCPNPMDNCEICGGSGIAGLRDNGLTAVQCTCVSQARYMSMVPHFIHSCTSLGDSASVLRMCISRFHPRESHVIHETPMNLQMIHTLLQRVHRSFPYRYVESGELIRDHFGNGTLTAEMEAADYLMVRIAPSSHKALPGILEDLIGTRDRLGKATWILLGKPSAAKLLPSLGYKEVK